MHGSRYQAQQAPVSQATGASSASGMSSPGSSFNSGVVYSFLAFVVFYLIWAFVETHEGIEGSVKPQNIKINLRTILLVTFTAIMGITVAKVTLAKAAAWGIPGASYVLGFVQAA